MQHEFHKLQEKARGDEVLDEDKELSLWEKWVDEESPNTFGHLALAQDGGFSEVKALYTASRWSSALMLILFVVYNVYSIIEQDVSFMVNPVKAAAALNATEADIAKFYFTEGIVKSIAPNSGLKSVQVLGFLELCGLTYYLVELVACAIRASRSQGFTKWFSIYTIFWSTLPTLSIFSAMKLLYSIVPTILISRASELVGQLLEAKGEGRNLKPYILKIVVWILFSLGFGGIIGIDTFLMKLRIVSVKADTMECSFTFAAGIAQFVIQVMGVVQLGSYVRERLFRFIFGGEDAVLQDEEIVLMETWNALLAKRIHRELSLPQFIAVMSSFSDEDFQSLVLNENAAEKSKQLG